MGEISYRHEINLSEIADEYAKRLERQVDEMVLDRAADTLERFGYVKVVRCRDCRMFGDCEWNYENEPMGFCAWACRKEGGDD